MPTRYRLAIKTVTVVAEELEPFAEAGRKADVPDAAAAVVVSWLEHLEADQDREHVGFLALDGRHRVIGIKVVASGASSTAPVDARLFWRYAIELGAAGVIVFHTHPSGALEASSDDVGLTRRLIDGGNLLGVPVFDHLIVAPGRPWGWFSMRSDVCLSVMWRGGPR